MVSAIRPRYRRPLALLLALAALLTATRCGGNGNGNGNGRDGRGLPDRVTACEVLTEREVARVLGGAVDAPERAEAPTDTLAGRSGCAWSRADGERAVLIELVRTKDMSSSVRRTGFSAAARFDSARHQHPDAGPVGVGSESLFVETTGTLHVLDHDSYLTFEVAATPPSAIPDLAEALARLAVARLRRDDGAD